MEQKIMAVRLEALSKRGDDRYVLIDRDTRQIVDDCHGHGYKSPDGAHRSWAHKQKFRGRRASVVPVGSVGQKAAVPAAPRVSASSETTPTPTAVPRAATPQPIRHIQLRDLKDKNLQKYTQIAIKRFVSDLRQFLSPNN